MRPVTLRMLAALLIVSGVAIGYTMLNGATVYAQASSHNSSSGKSNSSDAAAALKLLKEGNRRYVAGRSQHPHEGSGRRQETVRYGQHPKAVILSCADSRVPPELLFDQGIGDVFDVRVAGNVGNTDEIASIEYAAEHLHVPLCVVLGHSSCGAVTAVVNGDHMPGPSLPKLTEPIGKAVQTTQQAHPELKGDKLIAASIETNVWESIADILRGSEELRRYVREGKLMIVGAVYDLKTGQVRWLGVHPRQNELSREATP